MAIAAVAIGIAAGMWIDYARAPDGLWRSAIHDRNGYLSFAMTYAGAFRAFDLVRVIEEAAQAVVWPPLNGLILGLVLVPWMDFRMGPAVSLTGWCVTVIFAAMIARRVFREPLAGNTAAVIAAIFVAASPTFRLLGSDVMLEGPGAGLSALGLWLYLRASERPDDSVGWRWLALCLSCLFFLKYNYWAMLVASLSVSFVAAAPHAVASTMRRWARSISWRRLFRSAVRDPLLIAACVVAAVAIVILVVRPEPIMLVGRTVGLYPPGNIFTLAYALIFLRGVLVWRQQKAWINEQLHPALRTTIRWHVAPVLLSFVIPKRLAAFVWFLGPLNSNTAARSNMLDAALFQWQGFAEGFHVATWSALLVVALASVGGMKMLAMRGGAKVIALFPLISALALLSHPQQQWRFEATWLFGVWICAGVGGAMLLAWATRSLAPSLRRGAIVSAIVVLGCGQIAQPVGGLAFDAALRQTSGPSDMEFARAYIPYLDGREPVGFISSFGRSEFFRWTARSACGCYRDVEQPFNGTTSEEAEASAQAWLATTKARTVIVVDAPGVHEMPVMGTTAAVRRNALNAIGAQTRFKHVADVPVPAFDAKVSIWKRQTL